MSNARPLVLLLAVAETSLECLDEAGVSEEVRRAIVELTELLHDAIPRVAEAASE